MALRILIKSRFINYIQPSRALSSVAVIRNHVKLPENCRVKEPLLAVDVNNNKIFLRHNYGQKDKKKGKGAASTDEDDEDNLEEYADDVDKNRITKIRTQSMRCDLLLKSALAIGRNKIEQSFYEGKIRVNGKKIVKKSHHCDTGDVIEIVKGDSPTNPDHYTVSSLEILDVKTDGEEFIFVTMKRFRNLTVDKEDFK